MMQKLATVVENWRYDDGTQRVPEILRTEDSPLTVFRPELIGWHCYVYPVDRHQFEQWMDDNMSEVWYTVRFNGYNIFYTVHIKDADDASIFKLKWGV